MLLGSFGDKVGGRQNWMRSTTRTTAAERNCKGEILCTAEAASVSLLRGVGGHPTMRPWAVSGEWDLLLHEASFLRPTEGQDRMGGAEEGTRGPADAGRAREGQRVVLAGPSWSCYYSGLVAECWMYSVRVACVRRRSLRRAETGKCLGSE